VPTTDAIRALRFEEQDLSAGDLELEAEANESYRVMDLGINAADDDTIVEVSIGEESMMAFPADNGDDNLFDPSTTTFRLGPRSPAIENTTS